MKLDVAGEGENNRRMTGTLQFLLVAVVTFVGGHFVLASLPVRQSLGDDLLIVVDIEKNFAREFAFDYIGASPIDVVNVGQELGLAIGSPQDSTLMGARANYQLTDTVEAYGFYRNRLVKNKDQTDAFTRPFQELGLASSALIGDRLSATGQYKLRVHDLEGGDAVGVGSA